MQTKQLFIGIDVHKTSWSVNIRTDLFDHKTFSMPSEPEILINYVNQNFQDYSVECCYEASCCGFIPYRRLSLAGWSVKVLNPSDIPQTAKNKDQKTDNVDCRHLAKQLRSGHLTGIYVPDEQHEQLRSLFRQKNNLTKTVRKLKSQIKGELLYYGIKIPQECDTVKWTKRFITWLNDLEWKYSSGHSSLHSKLRYLDFARREWLTLNAELREYVRSNYNNDFCLLMSIPGIGPTIAIGILAELGDIRRFNKFDHLASYVGLIPSIYSSGDTMQVRGLTYRRKNLLRSYMIESAWVSVRRDPTMQEYYRSHSGKQANKIIIKVAHKLLRRIWHVVRTGEEYKTGLTNNASVATS
ncbi:IS110 family transposase [Mucilaginibacter sp. BJC16-A38]|uniref:IS110 family transposase n=1 Tax=Mucilaginibacter phenanthrenivorans TaxID=1234842 RepID=UPI0021587B98|nr:IS110 family transposase [Mucilaginibacter phenanthrenivorans]MCR8560474.1 IS110 family transposase [Mucilaginibacter phenanthrenivorans]